MILTVFLFKKLLPTKHWSQGSAAVGFLGRCSCILEGVRHPSSAGVINVYMVYALGRWAGPILLQHCWDAPQLWCWCWSLNWDVPGSVSLHFLLGNKKSRGSMYSNEFPNCDRVKSKSWWFLVRVEKKIWKKPQTQWITKIPPFIKTLECNLLQKKHCRNRGEDGNRSEWDQFYSQASLGFMHFSPVVKSFWYFFPPQDTFGKDKRSPTVCYW